MEAFKRKLGAAGGDAAVNGGVFGPTSREATRRRPRHSSDAGQLLSLLSAHYNNVLLLLIQTTADT
ncbi:hypothetical protein P3T76_012933 [Phytophthora citrophthora]|uniref:Uncharacterized protein n=1 Tax=Phytophthora citrophthora TaxID=4793 RepID=A0AAD9G3S2_9STRA|nr:hypothetical protein P3T76_012933 [Phytophthora citrophthora]